MSTFEIVVIAGFIGVGIAIYVYLFQLYTKLELWVDRRLSGMADALENLWETIKDRLLPLPVRIGIMIVLSLVSILYITISFVSLGSLNACFQAMIDGTTIGSFLNLAETNFSFSDATGFPAMVGAALSSFLSFLFMHFTVDAVREIERDYFISKWITYPLCALFNILFTCMSYLFAIHLADWYVAAANLLVSLFDTMSGYWNGGHTSDIWGLLSTIGTGLGLLAMLIAALATFIIVVREYVDTIFYGILAIFLTVVFAFVVQEWLHWPEIITAILGISSFLTADIIRSCDPAKDLFRRLLGAETSDEL